MWERWVAAVENLLPGLTSLERGSPMVKSTGKCHRKDVPKLQHRSNLLRFFSIVFSWQIVESPGKNQAVELLVKAGVGNLPHGPTS